MPRERDTVPMDPAALDQAFAAHSRQLDDMSAAVAEKVDRALRVLSPTEAALVEMRMAQMTFPEIAEQLGRTPRACERAFARCKKKLRRELEREGLFPW